MAKKEKKKGPLRIVLKVLLWVLITALVVVGAACFYFAYRINHTLDNINRGDGTFDDTKVAVEEGLSEEVINLALFGVDSRGDGVEGRSDAMMIVSIDMKHNKIKAVSIMRDSLVTIEQDGAYAKRKINSAYARGGVQLAVKTLNQNFNMNITDYVALNFNQMAGIVDALGGVEVEVTEAERRNANKFIKEMAKEAGVEADLIKESGTVTLYGYQAVAYARIRYVGNADFERTERQREVMEKLMNKILAASATRYLDIVENLIPMVETSLTKDEILEIAKGVIFNGKPSFEQGRFPLDGTYTTNESYSMVYDLEEAADKLHRFIYDDEPFYEVKTEE